MVKNNTSLLHFSLGPVQGFVAQARRTRDLWAGSYLLSWLSGHAMNALVSKANEQSASVKFILPSVEQDPLFQSIQGKIVPDREAAQGTKEMLAATTGSLPNRFMAQVPQGFDGNICKEEIATHWENVSNAVLELINLHNSPIETGEKSIWTRQHNSLWECTWAIGENASLIDQRKNMRIHIPPHEPGEKCTVCGERQELSGLGSQARLSRKDINDWWRKNIYDNRKIHNLDLRDGERLCAICITKRLFPLVAKQAIGWEVPRNYQSTLFMSAVDWLCEVLKQAGEDQGIREAAKALSDSVPKPIIYKAEKRTYIKDLEESYDKSGLTDSPKLIDQDGGIFYESTIQGYKIEHLNDEIRQKMSAKLKKLQQDMGKHNPRMAKASPFYALLLMDGDGMGALLSQYTQENQRQDISSALAQFTSNVPLIIYDNNGRLIYAGGDDVFALLPISKAIDCANACRTAYHDAFREKASFVKPASATISAAINYAHMNTALSPVVKDTHQLLDNIAKDQTGRDAIACRVWKRGGPILTWSQPWEQADNGNLVARVQHAFQHDGEDPDKFSSKFFYGLRDVFSLAQADSQETDKFDEQTVIDLLVVSYLANREHNWNKELSQKQIKQIAEQRVGLLSGLCRSYVRKVEDGETTYHPGRFRDDGALLVRFLSQKEV